MSVDLWTQRLHAEVFADDPPCAECGDNAEFHDEDGCVCNDCDGYRPDDPRNHAPDDYDDPED